jgi:hypothetical protein
MITTISHAMITNHNLTQRCSKCQPLHISAVADICMQTTSCDNILLDIYYFFSKLYIDFSYMSVNAHISHSNPKWCQIFSIKYKKAQLSCVFERKMVSDKFINHTNIAIINANPSF